MTTIYCDEAGNTGANLLDPEQPIFVLASNDFSKEEALSLLEHVSMQAGSEPKFSTLKKRPEGVAKLIRFLSDPRVNRDRVFTDASHKRFMIIAKMVDLVAETLINHRGGDLYKRGRNIAMSNMLYFCMPVYCGEDRTNALLSSFVDLIRNGPATSKAPFYEAGQRLMEATKNNRFKAELRWLTDQSLFDEWYVDFDHLALDPAIPSLFTHIAEWGNRKADRFHVLHDRSKPIHATLETFESMLAQVGEVSAEIGYDRRKIRFPLRALSLSQAESTEHPQIQIADLCAGAISHYYKCLMSNTMDELAHAVEALRCLEWGEVGLFPSKDVTPEAMGTDADGGINPVDEMAKYLDQRSRRGDPPSS